jgi:hypothetical protein
MAHAQTTTPTSSSSVVIDARRALPMFPAMGYRDGFFIEHSYIGDFGLHARVTGVYGRDPLGSQDDNQGDAIITNRFTLHAAAILSLAEWVELGLTMPFVLYQDDTGFMLNQQAIGDLRALGKINLHLPKNWPQIALSVGLGFETATNDSVAGAGTISGYPKLIIDFPFLLGKRLHIAANIGAVIAGTTRPCTQAEIDAQAMGMTMTAAGMGMAAMSATDCEKRALGLGDHFIYGLGVSGKISDEQRLYVTTELLGSVSLGTGDATRTPLFWDIGIRRALANATYFAASYGIGLTSGSPSHTVLVSLGLVWETKPPPPPAAKGGAGGPTIKLDINITGLPPNSGATVGGKEIKTPPPAPPPAAGAPKPATDKPPPPKSATISTEIDVPAGLVPADSKPAGGGGGSGPPKKH